MKLLLVVIGLALTTLPASATTRAYLMNGLLGEFIAPLAMPQIAARLRAHGDTVIIGSWTQEAAFVADACAHRGDRIIVIGHSLGGLAAGRMARAVRRCGGSVYAVSVDPPRGGAGADVNFVGALGGSMAGSHNVPVRGYSHIGIINDPTMQQRIIGAVRG